MKKILFSLLVAFIGLAGYSQVQVGNSTSTTTSYPVNCFYNYSYSEQIYLQSEINASGNIDTLSFYFDGGASAINSSGWTIYLGHTTKDSYVDGDDWITAGGLTQVFIGTVNIPTSGWFKIGLTTPFNYNNIDNLVVAIDENASGYDASGLGWRRTSVTNDRAIYSYDDGVNFDPLSPVTADGTASFVSNIIFGGIQQSCPVLSGISSYATTASSTNVTWASGANDSIWMIEYDTTGFVLGTGNMLTVSNDSALISGLLANTSYDVYVRGICHVGDSSAWIGPLNITTLCSVFTPSFQEGFSSYLPDCWEEAEGKLNITNTIFSSSASAWKGGDYLDNASNGKSAKINNFGTTRDEWLISPSIDLGNGSIIYQLEFDVALTNYNNSTVDSMGVDDTLALVISTDNGVTWSQANIIDVWTKDSLLTNLGSHVIYDLSAYTGIVKFGFYAASSVSNTDYDLYINDFLVRTPPLCADPVGLTAYKTTYDSIALTWTAGVNDSAWIIQYDTAGFTPGTGMIMNSANDSLVLTPVNELYTYDIYLMGICAGGDSSIWLGPITVSTPSSCPKPTAFTSYGVGIDTVALKWTTGPNDSVWLVEYGVSGFTPGTGTSVVSNNDSLVVTGLSGARTYDFYLRGVCTLGDTGVYVGPLSITTDCPVAITPAYNQGFATYVPQCWTEAAGRLIDSTTFSSSFSDWTSDGFGNVGSSGAARIEMYYTGTEEWLISPSFDLGNGSTTYQLEFDVALTQWSGTGSGTIASSDTIALLASRDNGVTWSDTGIIKVWDENNNPSVTGDRIKIRLSGYTDTVKFAFYAQKDISGGDVNFYVDNFDLIIAPTCPEGDSLAVVKYGSDTAMLTWNPGLFDNSWVVEYDTTGFVLGTGSTMLASNDTTTVSGLTPLTTYDFYVRSVCAVGDSSLWIGPLTVSTKANCPAPTTISDFLLARDSNNITWDIDPADSLYYIEWDTAGFTLGTGNMVTQADDTIALTGLTPNTIYSFYVRTLCKSVDTSVWTGPFTFTTIKSCPNLSSISEFSITKDSANLTWVSGQYDSVWLVEYDTVGFTVGTGNTLTAINDTIGINGLDNNTTYQVYVRSICTAGDTSTLVGPFNFTTLSSCPSVDSIFAFGINFDSANIAWNNGFYDSSWIIEYDTIGFVQGTGNVMAGTNDTVSLLGLTSNTTYEVYVRSICSLGDSSTWVGPFDFTTPCSSYLAPWIEEFSTSIFPACWSQTGDNNWEFGSGQSTPTGFADYGAENAPDYSFGGGGTFIGMDGSDNNNGDVSSLLTPFVDVSSLTTPALSYAVFSDNTDDAAQNKLIVDFYDGANWNRVDSIQDNLGVNWNEKLIDLSSYTITGNVQARFTVTGVSNSGFTFYNDILIDDVQFYEMPTCPKPTDIIAYGAGKDSVNLTWTPGANDVSWVVEYGVKGYTVGTGTSVVATNDTTTISGLLADTEYDFYVRGFCGVGDSSLWIGAAVDTTLPLCIRTQAFTILSSTATSINVGWNLDPSHVSYIVEYGPVGYTPGTGTTQTTAVPNNFVSVAGLTSSTEYDFYIKSVCSSGDTSVWEGPYVGSTECSTVAIPWTEGFESVSPVGDGLMPLCMVEDGDWETRDSNSTTTYNRAPRTGSQYMTVEYDADDWVFTPKFDLDTSGVYEFSFWYLTDGLNGWDEVSLHAGTDQLSTAMTTVIGGELNPSHTTYKEMKGYFKPTANGVYAFGVYVDGPSFSPWYLTFDDFNVRDTTQFVSINELNQLSQFEVYPNPNNGEFIIVNEGNSLSTVVKVLDMQGRVVYDENVNFSFNDRKEFNLSNVNTGMYLLQISSNGRTQQHRIVIE